MKLNRKLDLRKIGNKYMIVNGDAGNVDMVRVFSLNRPAAWLWQRIGENSFTIDLLVDWLCEEYDVAAETARKDVVALIDSWTKCGLVDA